MKPGTDWNDEYQCLCLLESFGKAYRDSLDKEAWVSLKTLKQEQVKWKAVISDWLSVFPGSHASFYAYHQAVGRLKAAEIQIISFYGKDKL